MPAIFDARLPARARRPDRRRPDLPDRVRPAAAHRALGQARRRHGGRRRRARAAVAAAAAGRAVAVKLTSPGPVFFRQQRVGLDGRPFPMLKFRSDVRGRRAPARRGRPPQRRPTGACSRWRTTRASRRWAACCAAGASTSCRRSINVLRGEMSLVGPRPPLPREVAIYETARLRAPQGQARHHRPRGRSAGAAT